MAGGGDGGLGTVARTYLVLGLAAACFSLYAISLDPATFHQLHLQRIKDPDKQQLEHGQTADCAATATDAMEMRDVAVVLLLSALTHGMAAVAETSRMATVCAVIFVLLFISGLLLALRSQFLYCGPMD